MSSAAVSMSRTGSRSGSILQSRPSLDKSNLPHSDHPTSSSSSSIPIATNSIVNKVASASSSLYQNCRGLLGRLCRVPGFAEAFIPETGGSSASLNLADPTTAGDPLSSAGLASGGGSTDPVSRSLSTLRLGSSLCFLFNALGLDHILEVNPAATMSNLKACQRGTAHFIMACKQDLGWSDQDLFAIHELYGQDTNGVVKVINTVTKLLDLLETQGILLSAPDVSQEPVAPAGPSDDRTMIVKEMLDTERQYVSFLEVLQDYQRQVLANDIISQDQIHGLFLNLNALADFQRRFLIGVEANASQPPEHQRFGHLFLQMEDHFSVYEPYCANLTAAQDLAIAQHAALSQLSHVLDPISELAPLLIKPVQRLCKYPLLLQGLVKKTDPTTPFYAELEQGLASIKRVMDKVNETTRREDNRQAVVDLGRRVEDWKGHDIASFGELLLQETFFVIKNDSEREYNVYLFERIILCCKESGSAGKKSKSNSILKKPQSKKPASLQLKGRIFVNNVTGAAPANKNGQCLLEVRWRGDVAEEAFTIKCRTEELLRQWQRTITKAVEDSPSRRRAYTHLSSSRRSERGLNSPQSQFPATPLSESGPSSASLYAYPHESSSYPHVNGGHTNGFDDEGEDYREYESGRSTPNMSRRGPSLRSLPSGLGDSRSSGGAGARVNSLTTAETSSSVIHQWRSQTPASSTAGLQRGMSGLSTTGSDVQSLRSSASSRHLRDPQSVEYGGGSSPVLNNSTRLPPSHYQYQREYDDDSTPRPTGIARQNSQATTPTAYPAPPMLRNRSTSSPIVYTSPSLGSGTIHQDEWRPYPEQHRRLNSSGQFMPSLPPLGKSHAQHSGATLASASSASTAKRFSSSSAGTDRSSGASSRSAGATYTASTSPATTLPPTGALPALPSSASARLYSPSLHNSAPLHAVSPPTAVRVKVTFGDDTFVVVVLSSVTFPELVDKVLKKIRLCGGEKSRVEGANLRLRYKDEDGDKILITSGEDVVMAFEAVKPSENGTQTLVLFVTVDGGN